MNGILWWTRMVNAVRFLTDIQEALTAGKSVLLSFPSVTPWQDVFCETLQSALAEVCFDKTMDLYNGAEISEPSHFLFQKYLTAEEQKQFWKPTHKTYAHYLALHPKSTLNRRFVCITDIPAATAQTWLSVVNTYLAETKDAENHASFILMAQNVSVVSNEYLQSISYADYITEYDCLMFCLTLIASERLSDKQKEYISAIASNLAGTDIQRAGTLVAYGEALAQHPQKIAKAVFSDANLTENEVEERVDSAVWEAQLKLIFPVIERYRRKIIQKYSKRLMQFLPMNGSDGEKIQVPNEMEIAQLHYACSQTEIVDPQEYAMLCKMRKARNVIAHMDSLPYKELLGLM